MAAKKRWNGLDTLDLEKLDRACEPLVKAFGHRTYLVGTAGQARTWRDVDVRTILSDDDFDRLFGSNKHLWSLFCYAVNVWLRDATGLPIDYQVQRQTEANERHDGPRNPLGLGKDMRLYAGGGDATKFREGENDGR